MLHILFVILKIAGVILAVILGILLLLVCFVLFVPVCYKGKAEGGGTPEDFQAHGQVSWMFGLIKIVVDYRNKSLDFYIKAVWKKLGGRSESMQEEKETEYENYKECGECAGEPAKTLEQKEGIGTDPGGKEHEEIPEKFPENDKGYEECKNIPEENSGLSEEAGADDRKICEEGTEKDKEPAEGKKRKRIPLFGRIKGRLHGCVSKINGLIEKFKCTIRELCDKIEKVSEKKDKLATFITDETHVNALGKGKKELVRLLGHLPPKVFQADIRYGFEDPSLTGRVLAGFGVLYPFLGDHARITPDFQEKILEGSLCIRGRIYVVHFIALAVRLLLDRNVRRMIKDVRKFQL